MMVQVRDGGGVDMVGGAQLARLSASRPPPSGSYLKPKEKGVIGLPERDGEEIKWGVFRSLIARW